MCTVSTLHVDGYPMEDVDMQWLGNGTLKEKSVHNVANVEIPQFAITDYEISSFIEELTTGASHTDNLPISPDTTTRQTDTIKCQTHTCTNPI